MGRGFAFWHSSDKKKQTQTTPTVKASVKDFVGSTDLPRVEMPAMVRLPNRSHSHSAHGVVGNTVVGIGGIGVGSTKSILSRINHPPLDYDKPFSNYEGETRRRVLIVGAGFAGLSAAIACVRQGFETIVLERSAGLSPHGDAISIGPNAAKIWERWGLGDEMWDRSAQGTAWHFMDGQGRHLRDEDLRSYREKYGGPLLQGHRAQFLGALGTECRFLGVQIRLSCEVVEYFDEEMAPAVRTKEGEIIEADVILVADGVNSMAKQLLSLRGIGNCDSKLCLDPKYSIYRAAMKSKAMAADPYLAHLLDGCARTWIGEDWHAMITPMDKNRQIAFYVSRKQNSTNASLNWRDHKPVSEALEGAKNWDPVLVAAIGKFQTCLNWSLPCRPTNLTQNWISQGGCICLIGDAGHGMTPTSFQGGSTAIEDGASLAVILSLAGEHSWSVPLALRVYGELRQNRVAEIVQMGWEQRVAWHSYPTTRDPKHLKLLATKYYPHDAELHAITQFEMVARTIEPRFRVEGKAFSATLKRTGLEGKSSVPSQNASATPTFF
ncbi:FAD/NAD(P)-binding domain-containing protein [Meredithblackwellia eburnea MCA 4105]